MLPRKNSLYLSCHPCACSAQPNSLVRIITCAHALNRQAHNMYNCADPSGREQDVDAVTEGMHECSLLAEPAIGESAYVWT